MMLWRGRISRAYLLRRPAVVAAGARCSHTVWRYVLGDIHTDGKGFYNVVKTHFYPI